MKEDKDQTEVVKVIRLGHKKRVKRLTGNITVRDIIAGILTLGFGFAAIVIVFLVIFTNISSGFGWAAFLFGYASFSCLNTIGTDADGNPKELDF